MITDSPPTLYMLIGAPGTGKSTWRCKHMADTTHPTVVLSSDDYIDRLANVLGLTYSEAFEHADHASIQSEMRKQLFVAIENNHDLIVDRTNMNRKSRKQWMRDIPDHYRKVAVVFELDRDVLDVRLHQRAQQTGKDIPALVIDDMLAKFMAPTLEDYDLIIEGNLSMTIGTNTASITKEQGDFGYGLALLKTNYCIARKSWPEGQFIYLVPGSTFTVNRKPLLGIYPEGTVVDYHPHIDIKTASGVVVPWAALQQDLLADDWRIVSAPV